MTTCKIVTSGSSRKLFWLFFSIISLAWTLSITGCGGDEAEEVDSSENEEDASLTEAPSDNELELLEPAAPTPVTKPKKAEAAPDPNGVYLPVYEPNGEQLEPTKLNGKPLYSNGQGYFVWFTGSLWKLTTKPGGGRVVASGGEEIIGGWPENTRARFSPDEEYAKQALFRLAVAYQGSEDNANAIRLFKQFVTLYPDDKTVAEAYLSMGDLVISQVASDSQPNFEQITLARENYGLVRENTENIALITDSISNEGGLLERVADNPEGLVNFYLTNDKNADDLIDSGEFESIKAKLNNPLYGDLGEFDLSEDSKLDFGELYDLATAISYKELENLYKGYVQDFGSVEGAQLAKATEKIGFALEKQGMPSQMLNLYFEDIRKYGNDPSSIGVDDILKKYCDKYKQYEDLFGLTLDLLKKIQTPSDPVSFIFRNRQGIEEEVSGTVEEIIQDRKKLLAMLGANYQGMDSKIYSEMVKYRGAIFVNQDYAAKFKGYLKKYQGLQDKFPSDLSPKVAFVRLLREAEESGQKTLELRMRANLDRVGSRAGGDYNPQTSDFPSASAGVLVWMAEKMLAQNSLDDAVSAMERLVELYSDAGGDFLFDAHYLIGKAKEKDRDFLAAANHFESALTNSTWHANSNDARIRRGNSWFEVAEESKDAESYLRAKSSFEEVRGDTEAPLEMRAESSFMMGQCVKAQKDFAGAAFLFLETTLNFPSALKWAPKSYEQAIACYEQAGQIDQVSNIEKQYVAWQRKFLK